MKPFNTGILDGLRNTTSGSCISNPCGIIMDGQNFLFSVENQWEKNR